MAMTRKPAKKAKGPYPGLAAADFGLPATRGFPINTLARARDALSRMQNNATAAQQRQIASRIARRWPQLAKSPAVVRALRGK